MSKQKMCSKRKIAYKKQNLEHNCVLQESLMGFGPTDYEPGLTNH